MWHPRPFAALGLALTLAAPVLRAYDGPVPDPVRVGPGASCTGDLPAQAPCEESGGIWTVVKAEDGTTAGHFCDCSGQPPGGAASWTLWNPDDPGTSLLEVPAFVLEAPGPAVTVLTGRGLVFPFASNPPGAERWAAFAAREPGAAAWIRAHPGAALWIRAHQDLVRRARASRAKVRAVELPPRSRAPIRARTEGIRPTPRPAGR